MGLTKATYFYEQLERVSPDLVIRVTAFRCPPDVFLQIRRHLGFLK